MMSHLIPVNPHRFIISGQGEGRRGAGPMLVLTTPPQTTCFKKPNPSGSDEDIMKILREKVFSCRMRESLKKIYAYEIVLKLG
jgi:hypothetical protein